MKTNTINLIGHRGICLYKIVENTLPALEKALEAGFLIETDVQKIKDGYVLYHDKVIPGPNDCDLSKEHTIFETQEGSGFYLPGGKKPITECTLDELLNKVQFNKEKHELALSSHAGEEVHLDLTETPRIATLGELILLLKKFPSSKTFLEIKCSDIHLDYNDGAEEEIIGMLKDNGLIKNIIINTSSVNSLRHIRKANPDIALSIDTDFIEGHPDLAHDINKALKIKEELGISFWNPPFWATDEKLLEDFEKIGLKIAAWTQFENKKEEINEIKRLVSIGLKYMFTNQAEEAKKTITD